jgi:hypothetical protein
VTAEFTAGLIGLMGAGAAGAPSGLMLKSVLMMALECLDRSDTLYSCRPSDLNVALENAMNFALTRVRQFNENALCIRRERCGACEVVIMRK